MAQDQGMPDRTAEAAETIAADPRRVYDLVADLPQMGRLSPENTGGRWIRGANGPAVGARFRGTNRAGWRRWSTTCEVTAAEPGRCFAFEVTYGPVPIASWSYDFEAQGETTRVTERWQDRRPHWMESLSGPIMGVADRAAHNRDNMQQTLSALKDAAEKPS
jgi:hypothetical protein